MNELKFKQSFKEEVFETIENYRKVELEQILDKNDANALRQLLEEYIDLPRFDVDEIMLDDGDMSVANAKIIVKTKAQNLYDRFMIEYTDYLDIKEEKNVTVSVDGETIKV